MINIYAYMHMDIYPIPIPIAHPKHYMELFFIFFLLSSSLYLFSFIRRRWWEKENDTSYIWIANCCIWRVVVVKRDMTLLLLLFFLLLLYLCSQIYIRISVISLKLYSNTTKSRRYTIKQIQLIRANGNSNNIVAPVARRTHIPVTIKLTTNSTKEKYDIHMQCKSVGWSLLHSFSIHLNDRTLWFAYSFQKDISELNDDYSMMYLP